MHFLKRFIIILFIAIQTNAKEVNAKIRTIEGSSSGRDKKIAIVVSTFNSIITKSLLEGAQECLLHYGVTSNNIIVASVPGAFEIPLTAQAIAETHQYDAIICLGAVIRGATPHFEYVAGESAKGIANLNLKYGIPIVFGVLTTNTMEEAFERAGGKAGNKGYESALTALKMCNLIAMVKTTL